MYRGRLILILLAMLEPACGTSGARTPAITGSAGSGGSPDVDAGSGGAGGGATTDITTVPAGAVLFPRPGARGMCADPPLRMTFSGSPTLGGAGKVQVFDEARPETPAASVDLAMPTTVDTINGLTFNRLRPVYVDGNDVVIYLPSHPLAYGHSYYVTVERGAILGPDGASPAIADNTTWRFSTASAAPADVSALAVALDGSAALCSVQGALDAVPAANTAPVLITVAAGTYHEIVRVSGKSNITIHGSNRQGTVIAETNNDRQNPGTALRPLVGIERSNGFVIENLTIHNLTPQGGSQAETLRLQTCDQCVIRDADIISTQDTLLFNGRIYVRNSSIAGNVDFVWGSGTAYFQDCEIRTVGRAGYNVQARNNAAIYGFVFVDCKLTSDPGIAGSMLARVDAVTYPASNVAYLNCELGSHISAVGWLVTGATDTPGLRFWEYQSHDPTGALIDVSARLPGSRQLTAEQAAMMRDPSVVLAGWQPPN